MSLDDWRGHLWWTNRCTSLSVLCCYLGHWSGKNTQKSHLHAGYVCIIIRAFQSWVYVRAQHIIEVEKDVCKIVNIQSGPRIDMLHAWFYTTEYWICRTYRLWLTDCLLLDIKNLCRQRLCIIYRNPNRNPNPLLLACSGSLRQLKISALYCRAITI